MKYDTCPACNSDNITIGTEMPVRVCLVCSAFFGEIDEETSWMFADYSRMATGSLEDTEPVFYFDFVVDGDRRHGWINRDRQVVQIG